MHITLRAVTLALMIAATGVYAKDKNCWMLETSFGVLEPYMITQACTYFFHEGLVGTRADSPFIGTVTEEHPDRMHNEFIEFIVSKKMLALEIGTQVFDCQHDLEATTIEYETTSLAYGKRRTLGQRLPEYACRGHKSSMVSLRPVGEVRCYWVPIEAVTCKQPPLTDPQYVTPVYSRDQIRERHTLEGPPAYPESRPDEE